MIFVLPAPTHNFFRIALQIKDFKDFFLVHALCLY